MKMDTGHHKHTGHFEHEEFHFSPIPRQTAQSGGKAGGEPDRPFHLDHGPWSDSRDVIPFYFERNLPAPTTVDADRRQQHARALIEKDIDVRFASAREMASVSLELYVRGLISWDAYARLAFQPELHPDYDATIGALLGEQADPDKPRDFVRIWEERLAYERRYNVADAKRVRATERITLMMRRMAGITSIRA